MSSSLEDDEIPAPDPSARTVDPFESGTLELGAGEVVVLPFEVVGEGMLMRVVARSPDGAIDPVAALYDEAGTLLASSDDEGFGVNGQDSLIDLPLPTGNFQIAIADHGFEGTGPVDIRFFLQDPLPLGEAPSGSFDGADGPVVRTLEVTPGNPAPASVRVDAPVDTRLRLLAPDGAVLDETQEGGNPPLPTLTLGEGIFYLVASADEPVEFTFELGS